MTVRWTRSAAPRTRRSSTGSSAACSTTSWGRSPASTSAAGRPSRRWSRCSASPTRPGGTTPGRPGTKETRDAIIARALDEAGQELRAAYGDPAGWTWGKLHQATFAEATLGSSGIGPLEWYFNKGPFAAAGAAGAVNNVFYDPASAYANPDDPSYQPVGIGGVFSVTNLPSYRLSIDLADLDGAQIIQTTGQSGNPFDRHYGDMIAPWLTGGTVPLPFTPTAIHKAMLQTLQLVPKSGWLPGPRPVRASLRGLGSDVCHAHVGSEQIHRGSCISSWLIAMLDPRGRGSMPYMATRHRSARIGPE